MPKYFDLFPVLPYDISGSQTTNYEVVRNIFFRLRIIRDVINNISAYYEYIIKEGETPEILAQKFYRDPEAHWIIMMANDMVDAAYDWPLGYDEFNKYIYKKYYNSIDKSKIKEIFIYNAGTGYANGYINFEGGSGISTNARIIVNSTGSIINVSFINYGAKYHALDEVKANVSSLLKFNTSNLYANTESAVNTSIVYLPQWAGNSNVKIGVGYLLNIDNTTVTVIETSPQSSIIRIKPDLRGDLIANTMTIRGIESNLKVTLTQPTLPEVVSWTQDLTSSNNIHHYEKVIQRTESLTNMTTETRFVVNGEPYSNTAYYVEQTGNVELVLSNINGTFYVGNTVNTYSNVFVGTVTHYDSSNGYISFNNSTGHIIHGEKLYRRSNSNCNGIISVVLYPNYGSLVQDSTIPYYTYNDLADVQYVQVFNMGYATKNSTNTLLDAGRTVYQVSYRDKVTFYDHELNLNDAKRTIKVIKPEYYPQIIEEFNRFTRYASAPYLRKLIV